MPGAAAPAGPDDFSDVFGSDAAAPSEEMGEEGEGDDAESEDALDSAIDEAFTSEDPVARREAFKTACRLCKASEY